MTKKIIVLFIGGFCFATVTLLAQISYKTLGDVYIQDFNLLPRDQTIGWEDGKTLQGWYALYVKNNQIPETIAPRTGKSTLGGLASFGVSENRALGNTPGVATGSTSLTVCFQNDTGKTLNHLEISYVGQLWRIAGEGTKELLVSYHIGEPEGQDDWTAIPELAFAAPVQEPSNMELDGTLPENSEILSAIVTDVSWLPNEVLYIRFFQINNIHNKVFAIDDFSFSATP